MAEGTVFDVTGATFRLEPGPHGLQEAQRDAIRANWEQRCAANPTLYNGQTIMGTVWSVSSTPQNGHLGGHLSVTCRVTDYSTLVYWLEAPSGFVPASRAVAEGGGTVHCFSSAVITGSDGGMVLGRMASHTYNAGRVYMPAGTLEPDDFINGEADLEAYMRREVGEETGLDLSQVEAEPGYRVVYGFGRLGLFRRYRFAEPAAVLVECINAWLEGSEEQELAEVLVVRPGDVDADLWAAMPAHVRHFLKSERE